MEMGKPSAPAPGHTATLAAVGRALHMSTSHERLIEDRLALALAGDAGATLLDQLRAQTPADALDGLALAFAIRARYVEDLVSRLVERGTSQYLVLGAGLDTFAWRRTALMKRLRVFEVDLAAAQEWKKRRLAELGIPVPDRLTFIPLDFEVEDLGSALVASGFDSTMPTGVSWIAVSQYLGRPAIERTLRWAAGLASASRLVMTYVVPPDQLSELAQAGLAWTRSQAAARGEPFLSLFRPPEIVSTLREAGFSEVELVEDDDLRRLYLRSWPDAPLTGIERLVVATV